MSLSFIPDPRGLDFVTWARALMASVNTYDLPDPGSMDWHDWAERAAERIQDLPYHNEFSSWQEWAEMSVGALL